MPARTKRPPPTTPATLNRQRVGNPRTHVATTARIRRPANGQPELFTDRTRRHAVTRALSFSHTWYANILNEQGPSVTVGDNLAARGIKLSLGCKGYEPADTMG